MRHIIVIATLGLLTTASAAQPLTEADVRSLIEPDVVQFYPDRPPPPGEMMPIPQRRLDPRWNDCGPRCLEEFRRFGGSPAPAPSPQPGLCVDVRTGRLVPCGR